MSIELTLINEEASFWADNVSKINTHNNAEAEAEKRSAVEDILRLIRRIDDCGDDYLRAGKHLKTIRNVARDATIECANLLDKVF